jgi:hypothetical protein
MPIPRETLATLPEHAGRDDYVQEALEPLEERLDTFFATEDEEQKGPDQ